MIVDDPVLLTYKFIGAVGKQKENKHDTQADDPEATRYDSATPW